MEDSGLYECQVISTEKMIWQVRLNVIGEVLVVSMSLNMCSVDCGLISDRDKGWQILLTKCVLRLAVIECQRPTNPQLAILIES